MNDNTQPVRRTLNARRIGLLATTIAGLGAAALFVAPSVGSQMPRSSQVLRTRRTCRSRPSSFRSIRSDLPTSLPR